MKPSRPLELLLKRGALVAAANWPVVLVQLAADALFKTLLVVPILGGVALVALLVEGDPAEWLRLGLNDAVPAIVEMLMAQPVALAAFLGALSLVVCGGSVLMFAVKAGTITVLVDGERWAGAIEHPPLRADVLARANRFTLERFMAGTRALFSRYLVLGTGLGLAYLVAVGAYAVLVFGPPRMALSGGPVLVGMASAALIAWITLANFVYLLAQIAIAHDDCGLSEALARVVRLLARETLTMLGLLAAILALMILTTAASVLATAALGLIAFVPFVGLAALPLQILAWVIRGLVFQYIGLAGAASYLRLYRIALHADASPAVTAPPPSPAGLSEAPPAARSEPRRPAGARRG